MYQQALCRLGNFSAIQLSEPAPLLELLTMALKDDESMSDVNEKEKLEIAEVNTEILKENSEMINEYFSIHIDQGGNLTRLPVVLDQYTSNKDRLPEFMLTLGNDMNTTSIKSCLRKQKRHGLNAVDHPARLVSIHAAFPQASEVNGGRWDVCSGCFCRQTLQDLGEMLVDTGLAAGSFWDVYRML